jgi:hypothetical protein
MTGRGGVVRLVVLVAVGVLRLALARRGRPGPAPPDRVQRRRAASVRRGPPPRRRPAATVGQRRDRELHGNLPGQRLRGSRAPPLSSGPRCRWLDGAATAGVPGERPRRRRVPFGELTARRGTDTATVLYESGPALVSGGTHVAVHVRRDRGSADGAEPPPLPWRLDGPPMVVVADPGDGLVGGEAVEDGKGGQGGPGAAEATAAGDLDPLTAGRAPVGLVEGVEGLVPVGRDPEVRPADAPVRPAGRRPAGQDQGEVGRAGGIGQPPPPDPGAAGEGDQPGLVLLVHVLLLRPPCWRQRWPDAVADVDFLLALKGRGLLVVPLMRHRPGRFLLQRRLPGSPPVLHRLQRRQGPARPPRCSWMR